MSYILAVDDEVLVLESLGRLFKQESNYEFSLARSGAEALESIKTRRPDLLILDILMPEMDGVEVCREIRKDSSLRLLPILFLTAKDKAEDIVHGLDAGGDDYVVKPFALVELMARIRALLRRTERLADEYFPEVLEVGEVRLVSSTFQVYIGEIPLQLTSTEYRLMMYLMRHANQTLTLSSFLVDVWDYPQGIGDPDLVRSHIRNLRAKIQPNSKHKYILTIHGIGYMFVSQENS